MRRSQEEVGMIQMQDVSGYDFAQMTDDDNYEIVEAPLSLEQQESQSLTNSNVPKDLVRTCDGYNLGHVQSWGFAVGVLFIVSGIFNFSLLNLIRLFVNIYVMGIGGSILMLEAPTMFFNRGVKQKVYKWARLMSRIWGRALFYGLLSLLVVAQKGVLTMLCGFAILGISCVLLLISFLTAHVGEELLNHCTKDVLGDDVDRELSRIFQSYAINGKFHQEHLVCLGREAGRLLTMNERSILFGYLDVHNKGEINEEEFIHGMHGFMMGIKFL